MQRQLMIDKKLMVTWQQNSESSSFKTYKKRNENIFIHLSWLEIEHLVIDTVPASTL